MEKSFLAFVCRRRGARGDSRVDRVRHNGRRHPRDWQARAVVFRYIDQPLGSARGDPCEEAAQQRRRHRDFVQVIDHPASGRLAPQRSPEWQQRVDIYHRATRDVARPRQRSVQGDLARKIGEERHQPEAAAPIPIATDLDFRILEHPSALASDHEKVLASPAGQRGDHGTQHPRTSRIVV